MSVYTECAEVKEVLGISELNDQQFYYIATIPLFTGAYLG